MARADGTSGERNEPKVREGDVGAEIQQRVRRRVAWWSGERGDAILYALSALFAGLTAAFSGLALYRQWGEMAAGPYAAAAAASGLLAWRRARRDRVSPPAGDAARSGDPARRRGVARAAVFVFVLTGATVVPLALEVVWRGDGAVGHVQPEAKVIEHAAQRLAHGQHLYPMVVHDGRVVHVVPGQPAYESFFPYLPLMTVFGLPASTREPIRLTDARIFFSVATLVVVGGALLLCRAPREPKTRTLQMLTVLPTAALPLATGGDDMPIVAFLLLAMVLAQRRRPGWSGIVLGAVCAMKFTAWPLAALALLAARDEHDRRVPGRMLLGMLVVGGPVVTPFVLQNPGAFAENVILFPLGLAGVHSPAASALPGHVLVSLLPVLRKAFPVMALVAGGAVLTRRLVRRPPTSAAEVTTLAGWVMTVAILLAPATRVGYLLYPANFFVWSALLRAAEQQRTAARRPAAIGGVGGMGTASLAREALPSGAPALVDPL